ncbi:hypothetical protein QUB60_28345 [Microcoleus sp. A2-C5]
MVAYQVSLEGDVLSNQNRASGLGRSRFGKKRTYFGKIRAIALP